MAYTLEGRLLEVCTCKAVCPCWVGDDPDGGTCDGTLAWHFERGEVDGVDVSGMTFGMLTHIPGNVLAGNWRAVAFVDERASPAQERAILSVFTGKQGGPVADLASLVGEVAGVERVPITFEVHEGEGHFKMGEERRGAPRPVQGRKRGRDQARRHRVLDHPGLAGLSRQGLDLPGEGLRAGHRPRALRL